MRSKMTSEVKAKVKLRVGLAQEKSAEEKAKWRIENMGSY